jgi:hypothetical protein
MLKLVFSIDKNSFASQTKKILNGKLLSNKKPTKKLNVV